MPKEITYEDVKKFILEHFDDESLMNDLNRLTYAGTSKYKRHTTKGPDIKVAEQPQN